MGLLLCLFAAAFLLPSDRTYRSVQWELLWQVEEPELLHPTQLEVGPDGRVYVMDYGDMRLRVFTPDGQLQRIIGQGEGPRLGAGRHHGPGDRLCSRWSARYALDVAFSRQPTGHLAQWTALRALSAFAPARGGLRAVP